MANQSRLGNLRILAATGVMIGWFLSAFEPLAQDLSLPPKSFWDHSVSLRTGMGYKDNVALSSFNVQGSPFFASGLDLLVFRNSSQGDEFLIYVYGEDFRYLSSQVIDQEQTWIAQMQFKKELSSNWRASLGVNYLYQNQMFDSSTSETELSSVLAKGQRIGLEPGLRAAFGSNYVELTLNGARQLYEEPLDDYWEAGPKLLLGHNYGYRSLLYTSYEFRYRPYDTRLQLARDGATLEGESLAYYQNEAVVGVNHYLDPRRRWLAKTRLAYTASLDNGPDYFNYSRFLVSQQIRYRSKTWEARVQAKVSHYLYPFQTVAVDDPRLRQKNLVALSACTEKQLFKSLKLFAEYEFETSMANILYEEYAVNRIWGGLEWEF